MRFQGVDLVVDALFGTGLARDLDAAARGAGQASQRLAARDQQKVVAVDIPSGVDGTSGAIRGVAVEADSTVTFFRVKMRASAAAGPAVAAGAHLRAYRHPSNGARGDRRQTLRQRAAALARARCRCRRSRGTNIRAAMRSSSPAAPLSPARRVFRRRRRCARGRASSRSPVPATRSPSTPARSPR